MNQLAAACIGVVRLACDYLSFGGLSVQIFGVEELNFKGIHKVCYKHTQPQYYDHRRSMILTSCGWQGCGQYQR